MVKYIFFFLVLVVIAVSQYVGDPSTCRFSPKHQSCKIKLLLWTTHTIQSLKEIRSSHTILTLQKPGIHWSLKEFASALPVRTRLKKSLEIFAIDTSFVMLILSDEYTLPSRTELYTFLIEISIMPKVVNRSGSLWKLSY